MALAAHATDSSEADGGITDNTKRRRKHDGHGLYGEDAITNKKSPTSRVEATNRPGSLSPRKIGMSAGGGDSIDLSATAAPCLRTNAVPAASAAIVGGTEGQENEPPEASEGHHGDDVASSPASEERKAAKIRAQMSVLMVGLYEIIRQVNEGFKCRNISESELSTNHVGQFVQYRTLLGDEVMTLHEATT